MRRTRALGVFGLVLGLSGCAGTHHQHHFPALAGVGAGPAGANCGCRTPLVPRLTGPGAVAAANAGVGAGLTTSAVAATAAARPAAAVAMLPVPRPSLPATSPSPAPRPTSPTLAATSWSASASVSAPTGSNAESSATSLTPPGAIAVPVPAPEGVARHYFPTFGAEHARSAWDPVPPDLLGVRTSMAPAPSAYHAPSALTTPSPLSREELGSLSLTPSEAHEPTAAVAPQAHSPKLSREVVPVSAEVQAATSESTGQLPPTGRVDLPLAGPDLAVGDATAEPPKTLTLEHADPAELAGRPRLESAPEPPLVQQRDPAGPSTWVSGLAFEQPRSKLGTGFRFTPILRGDVRQAGLSQPKRPTMIGRFVRRVRSAGRAFLDPDSVGREAGDFAERGQGVERASTDRVGESAKR